VEFDFTRGNQDSNASNATAQSAREYTSTSADFQCKVKTYINNLHPKKHAELYAMVSSIITSFTPLWNVTLSRLKALDEISLRLETKFEWTGPNGRDLTALECQLGPARWDRPDMYGWKLSPKCGQFSDWLPNLEHANANHQRVDLARDHGASGLQVVVEFKSIHLTPTQPEFKGTPWSLSGLMVGTIF
jgi:hypothetical protein